jgi:hypothetical protein
LKNERTITAFSYEKPEKVRKNPSLLKFSKIKTWDKDEAFTISVNSKWMLSKNKKAIFNIATGKIFHLPGTLLVADEKHLLLRIRKGQLNLFSFENEIFQKTSMYFQDLPSRRDSSSNRKKRRNAMEIFAGNRGPWGFNSQANSNLETAKYKLLGDFL